MTQVFAQHPSYVHLTEKDGLPDIEFYDIVEDAKGFIWLAADKGLYRYDGKNFKNFTHQDKRGLSVFGLQLGPQGRVWCNNISGQYFYIEKDELILFKDIKEITKGQLAGFTFYENSLLLHAYPKLLRIDIASKEIIPGFDNINTYAFSYLIKNKLIVATDEAIKTYNNFDDIKESIKIEHLDLEQLRVLLINKKEHIFINLYDLGTAENKIFKLEKNQLKEIQIPKGLKDNKIIRSFNLDNLLWICTNEGVYVYDFIDSQFILKESYFRGKAITSIKKDFKGNYWFTSLRDGVFIIPNIHVKQYSLPIEISNITCMENIDEKTLMLGSTKGHLSIFKRETQELEIIKLHSKKKMFSICNNIYNDEVYASLGDASIIYNKKNKDIIENNRFINTKEISLINKNKQLYSTYSNAFILEQLENKKDSVRYIGNRRSYTSFYSRKSKNSYIGYVDDLEVYDEKLVSKKITFENKPIFAIDIDETNDGVVWVSTFNDGLIGIKDGKVVSNFTTKNGLLSNQTTTIKSDGNLLWIVTDKGVQLFDVTLKTFKSLTKKDGITSFSITDIVVFDDEVVFCSNKGLFTINKNKVFKNSQLPEIYFTSVHIEDKVIALSKEYILSPDENKIQFSFHANGYKSEKNIIYKYRLLGADSNDWSAVSEGTNVVTFNSLSAGNYEFQLKAIEKNGSKETEIHTVKIKIKGPVYKEWWFIFGCILLGTFLIISYYRNKIKKKEEKQQLLLKQVEKDKELVFLKLENLRSQMNPHFIFNALNSIQDYIVLNQKKLASDYLGKFADLIRMYLEHSTRGNITLSEEIEALDKYLELEKLRFEESLSYTLTIDEKLTSDSILIPTMLIQPFVENALKHGLLHKKNNRILKIMFLHSTVENNLLCIVEDNGIGRKASKEIQSRSKKRHQSFASQATQSRLELLNFGMHKKVGLEIIDLLTEEKEGIGTKVYITIPYSKI